MWASTRHQLHRCQLHRCRRVSTGRRPIDYCLFQVEVLRPGTLAHSVQHIELRIDGHGRTAHLLRVLCHCLLGYHGGPRIGFRKISTAKAGAACSFNIRHDRTRTPILFICIDIRCLTARPEAASAPTYIRHQPACCARAFGCWCSILVDAETHRSAPGLLSSVISRLWGFICDPLITGIRNLRYACW